MDSTHQLPGTDGGTGAEPPATAEGTSATRDPARTGEPSRPDETTAVDGTSSPERTSEAGSTSDVDREGGGAGTAEAAGTTDVPKPRAEADAAPPEERWAAFAPVTPRLPGRLRRAGATVGGVLGHEWTLAAVGAVVLAAIMKWPALRHPQYTLPQDLGDPALVTWLLSWPGHILLTDYDQLWHGNAFYPDRWSYAFTDSLLGYAPAGFIGDGPLDAVLRYNVLYVLVHALAFFGGYVLARQLGVDRIAALVLALGFAYAPWRLTQAGHLQVLSTGGIALALAMLARGHGWTLRWGFNPKKVRPRWIVAGWLVAAWQITLGFGIGLLFGYVLAGIVFAVAIGWLVRRVLRRRRHPIGRVLAANLAGGSIFGAVTVLMALPYLTVVDQHPNARREFEALFAFSPPLRGFVTAPAESWVWGSAHDGARQLLTWTPEMTLLPGFALLGLAAAGLFYSVWSVKVRVLLLAGVLVGTFLAMGTEFFDGEAYRVLYDWLPGWDALRTSGRVIIWVTLLLGILGAGAVAALLSGAKELALARGFPRPGPALKLAAMVPVMLILIEGIGTTPQPVVPRQPAAFTTVDGPIMVLPSDQLTDMLVMLWSTDRFLPMVNGGSGFTPVGQQQTRELTYTFPDQTSVSHLRSIGVATVIVLPSRVVGTPWEPALTATGDGLGITREEIDGVIVFHIGADGFGP